MSNDPTGWLSKAMASFQARDRDAAAQALQRLIAEAPALGSTWASLTRLAVVLGETDSAIAAARLLVRDQPGDRTAKLHLGETLARHGRHDEAIRLGDTLVLEQADDAAAWHFTGVCRIENGEIEQGVSDLRQALKLAADPLARAWVWQTLAGAKRFRAGDPDLAAMKDALAQTPREAAPARAILFYALGKALDDVDAVDDAFTAYAAGAAIRRQPTRPDTILVDDIVKHFDRDLIDSFKNKGDDSIRPIFVLGMPRSGTTLVEQILVSHPDVAAGAEIALFQAAAMGVGDVGPESVRTFAMTKPDGLASLARSYLGLLDQRFGAEGRVVDKTLIHTRAVGLIHAALPNARFIWLKRDPGAVAWSCFRTFFNQGLDWSWSLEDIAVQSRDEQRLHDHWTALLGDAILTVPYEALVASPQDWIPRIAEHVGLSWNEAMLSPHETQRAVASASFAQVTRPIDGGSADAWRRYETHLKPFFDAYNAG